MTIEEVIAHTGYTPQTLVDDIALLRLSEPADFTLGSYSILNNLLLSIRYNELVERIYYVPTLLDRTHHYG